MPEPRLNILGIYKPNITSKAWKEQLRVTGDEAYTKAHFTRLVLIEASVETLDGALDMGKLGQMQAEFLQDP